MIVKSAPNNCKAFDADQILSADEAEAFFKDGFAACFRYIPRKPTLTAGNLAAGEANDILGTGLLLGAVQHCPESGWDPTAELGTEYGQYAAQYASLIKLRKGMNLFLDAESPNTLATAEEVIAYANAWYDAVDAAGYIPGIYCGWGLPLSPKQLHDDLKFEFYWRAYNGPDVADRGYMIIQSTAEVVNSISIDPNTIQQDNYGNLPLLLSA